MVVVDDQKSATFHEHLCFTAESYALSSGSNLQSYHANFGKHVSSRKSNTTHNKPLFQVDKPPNKP